MNRFALPVSMSSRLAAGFRLPSDAFARKRGSNPDAVTGAVLVAPGLKAVPHHACPDAHGNTLTAVACQLSRRYPHTVQRHPLKTFLFVERQAGRKKPLCGP
jgi:hypothetical protein